MNNAVNGRDLLGMDSDHEPEFIKTLRELFSPRNQYGWCGYGSSIAEALANPWVTSYDLSQIGFNPIKDRMGTGGFYDYRTGREITFSQATSTLFTNSSGGSFYASDIGKGGNVTTSNDVLLQVAQDADGKNAPDSGDSTKGLIAGVLPNDPSGLPPGWDPDPTHLDPNGQRFRDSGDNILDFHKGRPGEPGWRGKDHYHYNNGDEHLKPGDTVPDPVRSPSAPWWAPIEPILNFFIPIYIPPNAVPKKFDPTGPTMMAYNPGVGPSPAG